MKTECKSCRIALTITILSFVAMFGSCVACISAQKGGEPRRDAYINKDGELIETRDKGVTDNERIYGIITLSAFAVGFIGSLGMLFTCSEREGDMLPQAKKDKTIWENNLSKSPLYRLEQELDKLTRFRTTYTRYEQFSKDDNEILVKNRRKEAAELDEKIKIVKELIDAKRDNNNKAT